MAGPDGALWFTEVTGNKIGRVTTAGVITEFPIPTAGGSPVDIAVGPDGALWFTELTGNKIGRITPAGAITEFPIPTPNTLPLSIVSGPDGALWFVEQAGNRVGRITPAGAVAEFPIPTAGGSPVDIAVGPDGALWFTELTGNKIGRITPAGAITELTVPIPNGNPRNIAAGPDGAVWFTDSRNHRIGRIVPGTVGLTVTLAGTGTGTVTSVPAGIACEPDCTEPYPPATAVTLSAAATGSSTFAGWRGGGCGGVDVCPLSLEVDTAVTAVFAPPGRAVVLAPPDGAVLPLIGQTPIRFTWTDLPGVAQYGLEFTGANLDFTNSNGTAPDAVNGFRGAGGGLLVNDTTLSVVLGSEVPLGRYQVRVIGLGTSGELVGSFSDAVTIVLASPGMPTITQPAESTVLARAAEITLVWTALAGVSRYLIEFTGPDLQFTNPNGAGPDAVNGLGGAGSGLLVAGTSVTVVIPDGVPSGAYQVRVIGQSAAGQFVGHAGNAVTVIVP